MEKRRKEKINNQELNEVISLSKKILQVLYLFVIVIAFYVLIKVIKELNVIHIIKSILDVLMPFFIGLAIAWLFNPFVKKLKTKGIKRSLGTIISYAILLVLIILIVGSIIPLLYDQIGDFADMIPSVLNSIKDWINSIFDKFGNIESLDIEATKENLFNSIENFGNELYTSLPTTILNFTRGLISGIGVFIIGLVIGFYFLLGFDNIGDTVIGLLPVKIQSRTKSLFKEINQSLRNYVNGALIDSLVVFIASSIAFLFIGVKAPLLFGFFCGLMNVIPYAGPYIGGAPAVIVAFSQSLPTGIATLIAIIIIQTIEGNILQTLIMSKTTKLHPITIIIGLLIFGHFWGILGMLLSTPIISIGKIVVKWIDEKWNTLSLIEEGDANE
jgi:predicted PurR-regulated permease PerM